MGWLGLDRSAVRVPFLGSVDVELRVDREVIGAEEVEVTLGGELPAGVTVRPHHLILAPAEERATLTFTAALDGSESEDELRSVASFRLEAAAGEQREAQNLAVELAAVVMNKRDAGTGSLRHMLEMAPLFASPVVTFSSETFEPSVDHEIVLDGELRIESSVTIEGPLRGDEPVVTLRVHADRDNEKRVILVPEPPVGARSVRISGLKITGGFFNNKTGGCILIESNNTLTLAQVEVFSCNAYSGGAVSAQGRLIVERASFHSNTAYLGGGGIWAGTVGLEVKDSVFTDNQAGQQGGAAIRIGNATLDVEGSRFEDNLSEGTGAAIRHVSDEPAAIVESEFYRNEARGGGAIALQAPLATIRDCSFEDNSGTEFDGGAIRASGHGEVQISKSRIVGNVSAAQGGGIYSTAALSLEDSVVSANRGGPSGGGIWAGGFLSVVRSTIDSNDAVDKWIEEEGSTTLKLGLGGGLALEGDADRRIVNSTITANDAGLTGGVHVTGGSLSIAFSTVVRNFARNDLRAPGVFAEEAELRLLGTVVAENSLTSTSDFDLLNGSFESLGHNFIGKAPAMSFLGSDRRGSGAEPAHPELGLAQDNGGPTPTLRPFEASPLIDAIDAAACTIPGEDALAVDQRGMPRPAGGACDIGAVEVQ